MLPAMIKHSAVRPSFLGRPSITAEQLRHVSEPAVVCEAQWLDDDGERCWAYTVGGWLDGAPLGDMRGGVTIGGEVMIVHADTQGEADALAALGLQDTIDALHAEEGRYQEAAAALARMSEVSPTRRLELATAAPADRSDDFERDAALIRPLRGDDIALVVGNDADGEASGPH